MARPRSTSRVEKKADVINLSWDLGIGSDALEAAIQKACDARCAGGHRRRQRRDRQRSLGDGSGLTRGASTAGHHRDGDGRYDRKASFSNYGDETVDLAAPGVDIVTTRAALAKARSRVELPHLQRHVGGGRPGHGRGSATQVAETRHGGG